MDHQWDQRRKQDTALSKEEIQIKEAFDYNGGCMLYMKEEPIKVSYVHLPNEFYIQRPQANQSIRLLHEYLSKIEQSNHYLPKVLPEHVFLYRKNDSDGKKLLYRILIQNVNGDHFTGLLLDTGESPIPLIRTDILHCPVFARNLRPLAFKSRLYGVSISSQKWSCELYSAFRNFLLTSTLDLRAKVYAIENKTLHIRLNDQLGNISEVFSSTGDPSIVKYNTKEVVYSDIIYNFLRKGSKYKGKVVHLGKGLLFCFVQQSEMTEYQKVIKTIHELYTERPKSKAVPKPLDVVVTFSPKDSQWIRCFVEKTLEKSGAVDLIHIDSGKELKNVTEVYHVFEEVAALPCYVHFCRLTDYNSNDPDDIFLGEKLIKYEDIIDFIVKHNCDDIAYVDIYP